MKMGMESRWKYHKRETLREEIPLKNIDTFTKMYMKSYTSRLIKDRGQHVIIFFIERTDGVDFLNKYTSILDAKTYEGRCNKYCSYLNGNFPFFDWLKLLLGEKI